MLATMRKPKWLALLAAVLITVLGFGWLGWWQLTSAFESAVPSEDAEQLRQPVALGELIQPGEGITEAAAGRTVRATAVFSADDLTLIPNRLQGDRTGWWIVTRAAITDDGTGTRVEPAAHGAAPSLAEATPAIPIALAWTATRDEGEAVIAELAATLPTRPGVDAAATATEFTAELLPGQDAVIDRKSADPTAVLAMAPGQFANTWSAPAASYYSAYLIGHADALGDLVPAGAEPIATLGIDSSFQLNLLNVFYAIEWAIFIVMAFYIWWRLVRDDYLAEQTAASTRTERLAESIRREKLRELAARRAAEGDPRP